MPQLKQLSCTIQWAETGAPFPEYGTVYGDGLVETFIVVPNRPQPFTIRLKSLSFIHEGLSMVVFIDGNYQANRNRVNLKPHKKNAPLNRSQIDFLLRQREKPIGDGVYMGREWRFDNHNIVEELPEGVKESHFDLLGTIEVLVLRCRARIPEEVNDSGSSSAADSDALGEKGARVVVEEDETPKKKPSNKNGMADTEIGEEKAAAAAKSTPLGNDGTFDMKHVCGLDGSAPGSQAYHFWPPGQIPPRIYNNHPFQGYHMAPQQPHFYQSQNGTQQSNIENRQPPATGKHVHFNLDPQPPPIPPRPPNASNFHKPSSYERARPPIPQVPSHTYQTGNFVNPEPFQAGTNHQFIPPGISQHNGPTGPHFQPQLHMMPPSHSAVLQSVHPSVSYPVTPSIIGPQPVHQYPQNLQYQPYLSTRSMIPYYQPWPVQVPHQVHNSHQIVPVPPWPPYTRPNGRNSNPSPATVANSSKDSNSGGSNQHQSTTSDQNQNAGVPIDGWKSWGNTPNDGATTNTTGDSNQNSSSNENNWVDNANQQDHLNTGTQENNGADLNFFNGPDNTENNDSDNNDNNDNNENNGANDGWDGKDDCGCNDSWDKGDNDLTNGNNAQTSYNTQSSTQAARALFGPHGQYYTYYPKGPDEPAPDAEEEPRYDVPKNYAEATGSTKQVLPGSGYMYWKRRRAPQYVDSLEDPYACFVFKYRTKDQLETEAGIKIEVEPTGNEAVQELQVMDKQTLIEMLVRAKSALGGRVPSPPPKPVVPSAAKDVPVAVEPPDHNYLKYKLPELRQPKAKTVSKSKNSRKQSNGWDTGNNGGVATGSSGNNGPNDWDNNNKDATWNNTTWNGNENPQNADVNWKSTTDGAGEHNSNQQHNHNVPQPVQPRNAFAPTPASTQNVQNNSTLSSPSTLPLEVPFQSQRSPSPPPPIPPLPPGMTSFNGGTVPNVPTPKAGW